MSGPRYRGTERRKKPVAATSDFTEHLLSGIEDYVERARQSIPGRDAIFAIARATLEDRLGAVARVLVVGAGGGEELIRFGLPHPEWELTGVDPSSSMLELARQRVDASGMTNALHLVEGTVEALPPVLSERFDAATCILTAHFVSDDGRRAALYSAIRTRLQSNGTFVLVTGTRDPSDFVFDLHLAGWRTHAANNGMPAEMLDQMVGNALALPMLSEERERELLRIAQFSSVVRIYQGLLFTGWLALP